MKNPLNFLVGCVFPYKRRPLKDYSDEELYLILQDNSNIDLQELSGFCSEVLRRMIEKEKSISLEKNAKVPPPGDKEK